MKKVNLFLVGAAKSGTTSVYNFLNNHSQVYTSPIKEPNYFSTDIKVEDFSNTYRRTTFLDTKEYFSKSHLVNLQLSFVRDKSNYNRLFEAVSDEPIIADCSTSYLYSNDAAKNIFEYNDKAKILIVLRNPIYRAYSHYLMALKYGFTNQGLIDSIQKDQQSENKGWGKTELFIELGLYVNQIKRYHKYFGKDNVKVMFFNDLKTQPTFFFKDLCRFLEIQTSNAKANYKKPINAAMRPKSPFINKILVDVGFKKIIKQYAPMQIQLVIKKWFFSSSKPNLTQKEIRYLRSFYVSEIEKLEALLEVNLKTWKR